MNQRISVSIVLGVLLAAGAAWALPGNAILPPSLRAGAWLNANREIGVPGQVSLRSAWADLCYHCPISEGRSSSGRVWRLAKEDFT